MKLNSRIEYLIPVVLIVLLFPVVRTNLPHIIYYIVSASATIYFFPIRWIVFSKNKNKKDRFFSFILNLLFAAIIMLSSISLLLGANQIVETGIIVVEVFLIIILVILFINYKTNRDFFMGLLFNALINGVIIGI